MVEYSDLIEYILQMVQVLGDHTIMENGRLVNSYHEIHIHGFGEKFPLVKVDH